MKISNNEYLLDIGPIVLGGNIKLDQIKDFHSILDTYFNMGGITVDTARSYCGGMSELALGRYIRKKRIRDKIIISTKAGNAIDNANSALEKETIKKELNKSLQVLGVEYIDLLWLHRDDERIGVDYVIDFMNDFICDGKIKTFGASNWKFDRIKKANEYAKKSGKNGFSASQIQWSVGRPNMKYYYNNNMLCLHNEYYEYLKSGFPVFAYSSQAKGFFYYMERGGEYKERQQLFNNDKNREIYEMIKKIALKENVGIQDVVLSFVHSGKLNSIPVVGFRTQDDIGSIMRSVNYKMSTADLDMLLDKRLEA